MILWRRYSTVSQLEAKTVRQIEFKSDFAGDTAPCATTLRA